MRPRHLLSGAPLLAVGAVGLLAWQGVTARRTIERLPEADGLTGACGEAGAPFHLVVLGDSVAAGVGIAHHDETLAGRLATLLAADTRTVRRTVLAESGLTAGGVLEQFGQHPEIASADLVVLSVGVNDALGLHSVRRWRRELGELLGAVTSAAPQARVVLLGVPDMAQFTRLPRPLRDVLGHRSRRLDGAGRDLAAEFTRVQHLPLDLSMLDEGVEAFAADGFHPSSALHSAIARQINGADRG